VAPDMIGRTAQAGSLSGAGRGVATEAAKFRKWPRSGYWRHENEPYDLLRAGSVAVRVSRRPLAGVKRGRRWA